MSPHDVPEHRPDRSEPRAEHPGTGQPGTGHPRAGHPRAGYPGATPVRVLGAAVDDQTRCVHYRRPLDIVAIRFHCCGEFYPCFRCHADAVDHAPSAWPRTEFDTHALLCGACRATMPISEYLDAEACPSCGAPFNPGCSLHHSLYFDG